MKLEEKSPIKDTTRTNSSGLFRNGKTENPTPCASREISRILFPLPVLSRMPSPGRRESNRLDCWNERDKCDEKVRGVERAQMDWEECPDYSCRAERESS